MSALFWRRPHTWCLAVLVASQHDYYIHLATVSQVVSAVVSATLWPLILFGASLHLNVTEL